MRVSPLVRGTAGAHPSFSRIGKSSSSARPGDPQPDSIFSALLAQAFDGREDSVFEPELCAEDGGEVRDYVIAGLDRGTAVNDRSALLFPAHAIADTHFDAKLLRSRFTSPLMAGVVTARSSPSRAIHTGADTAFPDLRNVVSEIKRSSPRAEKARGRLMLPGYRGAGRTPGQGIRPSRQSIRRGYAPQAVHRPGSVTADG